MGWMVVTPTYSTDYGVTPCSILDSFTSSPYSLCGRISSGFRQDLITNTFVIGIVTFAIVWVIAAILIAIFRSGQNGDKS